MPRLLLFYRRLLQVQLATEREGARCSAVNVNDPDARLRRGEPLLPSGALVGHVDLLNKSLRNVCGVVAEFRDLFAVSDIPAITLTPSSIQGWLERGELPQKTVDTGKAELTRTILQAAFKPLLRVYARHLSPAMKQESWRRSYCPVCGGNADLAYLAKEGGARWLVCACCDTEWVFQRIQCPHCGTQDQEALSYLTSEGDRYRLYLCNKCKHYLKTVDLRQVEDETMLPLERFQTLDMDIQARQMGYTPSGTP